MKSMVPPPELTARAAIVPFPFQASGMTALLARLSKAGKLMVQVFGDVAPPGYSVMEPYPGVPIPT